MTWSRFRRASKAALLARVGGVLVLALVPLLWTNPTAHATLNNGENAVDILGQFNSWNSTPAWQGDTTADYVKSCVNNGPGPLGFAFEYSFDENDPGIVIDSTNHRLFVADTMNHRVLVFTLNSGNQLLSKTAANVIGQNNFISCLGNQGNGNTPSASSLSAPSGLDFDPANNRLFVVDYNNARVLIYNTATITNGMSASYVLGQTGFTTSNPNTTQSTLDRPVAVVYDSTNTRLFVSDGFNNRVMVFSVPTGTNLNGENASYELGQTSFTSGNGSGHTQSTFSGPGGLAYDSADTLLYMDDYNNSRVLAFNVAPSYLSGGTGGSCNSGTYGNGEKACYVIGQANFTGDTGADTEVNVSTPFGLAYDSSNNRLFVSEAGNNRVTVFPTSNVINGENATDILGQFSSYSTDTTADYTHNCVNNGPGPVGFYGPVGSVIDTTYNRLFVADAFNNRILVFPLNSSTKQVSSKTASYVIGQPDFKSCGVSGQTAASLSLGNDPASAQMAFDSANNRLFVNDTNNNRVLIFNTATITNGMSASYELGQPSGANAFTTAGTATTQSGFNMGGDWGGGIALDATNQLLYVSDSSNNRVMVFNVAPAYLSGGTGGACSSGSYGNGENACYVLGQSSWTAGSANGGGSTGQAVLSSPDGIALDPNNYLLYVADSQNGRVMAFPAYSNAGWGGNGENALYELGQPSGSTAFTSSTLTNTQSGMYNPASVSFDATNNRLFVADEGGSHYSRILIFNTASISNGENASYVLGQPNFTTINGGVTDQSTVSRVNGLTYDSTNNYLYAADTLNNRVMIFNLATPSSLTPSLVTQSGNDACSVMTGGQLYCWGYNNYGQDGLNDTAEYTYTSPVQVGNATNWTAISQGDANFDEAACGIAGGALYCWGHNAYGELGLGNTVEYNVPQQVGTDTTWTAISTSGNDTCGIDNNVLYCWGRNQYGELGLGNTTEYTTPQAVPNPLFTSNLVGWWQFSEGTGTTTADSSGNGNTGTLTSSSMWTTSGKYGDAVTLNGSNQVVTFGDSSALQLTGSWTISTWVNFSSLPASGNQANLLWFPNSLGQANYELFLKNVSGTYSWGVGYNNAGSTYSIGYAASVSTGTWYHVVGVYNSSTASLSLYVNGSLVAGPTVQGATPQYGTACCSAQPSIGGEYNGVYNNPAAATFDDARIYNTNLSGTQITSLYNNTSAPTWTAVSTGGTDTCGIAGGQLYCWGYNEYGEDGNVATSQNTVFITSTTYTGNMTGVSGANTDCQTRSTATGSVAPTGTYKAWIAETTNTDDPNTTFVHSVFPYVDVAGNNIANNWSGLISGGLNYGISYDELNATVTAGDVWTNVATNGTANHSGSSATLNCTGWTNASSPVGSHGGNYGTSGATGSTWTVNSNVACNSTNRLYCVQQVANPTQEYVPQQVGSATNWIAVSQGAYDTCGIRGSSGSGELYCWGENQSGELGIGNTGVAYGSPQAVGTSISTTGWSAVSIQYDGSNASEACGIVSGKLYCWGYNGYGQLGLGNTTEYNTPQEVGIATNWTAISTGSNDTCGVAGGVLYCWGYNVYGEDGLGNTTSYTSPQAVTVGGSLNGEDATDLLGQYNSVSSTSTVEWYNDGPNNGPTALGVDTATSAVVDSVNHYLYVADSSNNRVLVYALNSSNTLPTSSGGHTATYVLGQTNLQGGNASACTQSGLNDPTGLAIDTAGGRLFVADTANNRVLIFGTSSLATGESASNVLGQANFTSCNYNLTGTTTPAQNSMSAPVGLAYDAANTRLFIADNGNSRVLWYTSLTTGSTAAGEFGQASYTVGEYNRTNTTTPASNSLDFPQGLAYDSVNVRLFVADEGNNRVLMFSTFTNGHAAANELGQPSGSAFTSAGAYGGTGSTNQSGFQFVSGLAYDSLNARLYVSDQEASRVLEFNVAPSAITNGENASFVVGQPNFTNNGSSVAQSVMEMNAGAGSGLPESLIWYDPGSQLLYVPDEANNRVMIFPTNNAGQIVNQEAAQYVLGQANFTSSSANEGGSTGQATLSVPAGVAYDSTNSLVYVVDQNNNRVMQFNAAPSSIANGENASDELGQYTSPSSAATDLWTANGANNGPSALGFSTQTTAALDPANHALYVTDVGNNRILVYTLNNDNSIPTSSGGHTASYVIGQTSVQGANASGTTQSTFNEPTGVAVDTVNDRLFVADYSNNRVLVFNTPITSNGENAAYVLGQSSFTASGAATTQSGLIGPKGLAYDAVNSRLFVPDSDNNRVMVFNVAPSYLSGGTGGSCSSGSYGNGENACYELGQPSGGTAFTTNATATSQSGLDSPTSVAYDSANSRLFVVDDNNFRVLAFNVAPGSIANGENASYVLGQSSFSTAGYGCTQSAMTFPVWVQYDSNNSRLFVVDEDNDRVLAFNVAPSVIANGEKAGSVLGQPNFTTCNGATTQAGLSYPEALYYDPGSGRVFVSDGISTNSNSRIMIFGGDALPSGDYFNP